MKLRSQPQRLLALFGVVALLFTACGDDDDGSADSAGTTGGVADDTSESEEDLSGSITDSMGSGSATLTIGDEVFDFDGVQCAVGTDETQSDDFDFVLDVRQDGFQLQATTGTFGDEVTFHDIDEFDDPRQAWRSEDATVEQDGESVTAQAQFIDETDENAAVSGETVAGTLEATCG